MTGPSPPPPAKIARLDELDLVIVTERLRLRPILASDVDDLWPYVSDPELPRLMSWHAHADRSQTLEFVAFCRQGLASNTDMIWAIEHGGRAVGTIGLDGIKFAIRAWRVDRAELGYWIAPPLWNRGLITEAARAVMRFGFESLGLHKITISCIVENLASARVIEKLGFRFLACCRDEVWRDGRWWSILRYELTGTEWVAASDASTAQPP